jgi:16S rRNA (guanine527-N7)-methyltransferase
MTVPDLNSLLAEAGSAALDAEQLQSFASYMALLMRWNARTNLTAIRDEAGIQRRHFLESILVARALPVGITRLLDFGSGAGFPGIPIALCRPEIAVTLAESQNKKAAFLREAVRTLGIATQVHADRAEQLPPDFDCVAMRAVDKMEAALPAAVRLVKPQGWVVVMSTEGEQSALRALADQEMRHISWLRALSLAKGTQQVLLLGQVFARSSL